LFFGKRGTSLLGFMLIGNKLGCPSEKEVAFVFLVSNDTGQDEWAALCAKKCAAAARAHARAAIIPGAGIYLAQVPVRTGVSTTWRNPDSGYQYRVVPTRTYDINSAPCREYTLDASIGGETEQIYGTACRQADGSWKVKN
jgi:hypothetical protein